MTNQFGHTKSNPPVYPAYVNIKYDDAMGEFVMTMRGEPNVQEGICFGPGPLVQLRLTSKEAFDITNGLHLFVTEGRLHG